MRGEGWDGWSNNGREKVCVKQGRQRHYQRERISTRTEGSEANNHNPAMCSTSCVTCRCNSPMAPHCQYCWLPTR